MRTIRLSRAVLTGLIFACIMLCPAWALAESLETAAGQAAMRSELATIGNGIDASGISLQARRHLSELRRKLISILGQARDCITDASAEIDVLHERREALGEPAKGDNAGVIAARRKLDADIKSQEAQRVSCEQIAQTSQDLFERAQAKEQAALKARLLARGTSTPALVMKALEETGVWSSLKAGFIDEGSGWEQLSLLQHFGLFVVFAVLFAVGVIWRKKWTSRHPDSRDSKILVKRSPWLFAVIGVCVMLAVYLPIWPPTLVAKLWIGLLIWLVTDVVLNIWLEGRRTVGLAEADIKSLTISLRILSALLVMGGLLYTAEAVIQLPDSHYFLLQTAMAWLLFFGVIWPAHILGRVPGLAGTTGLRVFIVLAVLAAAIAETLGFRNLSIYLLFGFIGTAAGFIACNLTARLFTFIFDGLDEGQYAWQKDLRKWIGLSPRERVPGLIWIRLIASLVIWSSFVLWALWIWGQSELWVDQMIVHVREGFDVGSLRIAPIQILGAIAVLAFGISLSRWIKKNVISDLVKRTRLDRGGREAILTVSGYLGVMISILIAMGIAGISFTNLAIVAGALSVGIGFGLQNVVNNFISGLILLFERPVRTGDWVVVGDIQGFVRKISIRSTQIETFDRADIIVPNSDLISNKVSNLMLRDPWGRVIIPVGVAYGSDVKQVMEILLQVANEHEGVLKNQPGVPPPKALFIRFGDSALEFELRCFISKINKIFDTTSDLNIAIDQAFRQAGITIPFPQRDVHVKSTPPA